MKRIKIFTLIMLTFLFLNNGYGNATEGFKQVTVAGAIRNTGNGWQLISDSVHTPINVASVTNNNSAITIKFDFPATGAGSIAHIVSFVVGTDEQFSQQGYIAGATVNTSAATIKIGRVPGLTGYVYYDAADSTWKFLTGESPIGIKNVSFSNGKVTITHDTILAFDLAVQDRDGNYLAFPQAGTDSTHSVFIIKDFSGNTVTTPAANMNFYVSRAGVRKVDPTTLVAKTGNFWFQGIFEITQ